MTKQELEAENDRLAAALEAARRRVRHLEALLRDSLEDSPEEEE